jgi:precorrin-6A synthase
MIIGIGAGNPDLMTVQAIAALGRVDVFFIPDKGAEKSELRELRLDICRRFLEDRTPRFVDMTMPKRARPGAKDYDGVVDDWHDRIAEAYADLFARELKDGQCGGLLVWGDPALYDSTLRIVERLKATLPDLDYEVVPGISSPQLLAARHRIPLNRIGAPLLITPARRLANGIPDGVDDVVVVLDGEHTYRRTDGEAFDIYWGANLGLPDEILISGKLADVRAEIDAAREQARAAKGWVMDTYLLRRRKI